MLLFAQTCVVCVCAHRHSGKNLTCGILIPSLPAPAQCTGIGDITKFSLHSFRSFPSPAQMSKCSMIPLYRFEQSKFKTFRIFVVRRASDIMKFTLTFLNLFFTRFVSALADKEMLQAMIVEPYKAENGRKTGGNSAQRGDTTKIKSSPTRPFICCVANGMGRKMEKIKFRCRQSAIAIITSTNK